ncbi:unnamed protein product, partial [Prorocentrum cordatum]
DGVELLVRAQRQDAQACSDPLKAARAEDARLFLGWASQQVLPPMFARAAPAAPVFVRRIALECLNHFALARVFEEGASPLLGLAPPRVRYMELLGALATDTSPEILQLVCKGFVSAVEDGRHLSGHLGRFCRGLLQGLCGHGRTQLETEWPGRYPRAVLD